MDSARPRRPPLRVAHGDAVSSRYDLMRHALGVQEYGDGRWSKPYRNHYVAGGASVATWRGLVAEGLATVGASRGALTDECPVFYVTDAGRKAALDGLTFKRKWGYGTPAQGYTR